MREGMRTLREAGDTTTFEGMDPDNLPPFAVEDDDLDADGRRRRASSTAKMDAMRAHASQIATDGPFFAFSDNVGNRGVGHEFYRLVKGTRGTGGRRRARGGPLRRAVIMRALASGAARGLRRADRRRRAPAPGRAVRVDWPWGLVLALAATAAVALGAGRVGRVGEAWFALGWAVVILGQSLSPTGSYLVAADWLGLGVLAGRHGGSRRDHRAEL